LTNLTIESDCIDDYLSSTAVLDWSATLVEEKASQLAAGLTSEYEIIETLYHWVRDRIPHSSDIASNVVSCSASQVLAAATGICHAKSHLLAAMLRSQNIACGFCYQVLAGDGPGEPSVLHGLNAVYLSALSRWVRLDARGNHGTINAQFSQDVEQLAYVVNPLLGEKDYACIFVNPDPVVVELLNRHTSRADLLAELPASHSSFAAVQQ